MKKLIFIFIIIAVAWNAADFFDYFGDGYRNGLASSYAYFTKQAMKFGYMLPLWGIQDNVTYYYMHHPPLMTWAIMLVLNLFGDSEWSIRLIGLVFCCAWITLLCYIIDSILSRRHALYVSIVLAFIPLSAYYSAVLPESLNLFFVLTNMWCYYKYHHTKRTGWWIGVICTLVLGSLCDFQIHILVPLYFLHALTKTRSIKYLLWFPLLSAALIGAWIYALSITGGATEDPAFVKNFLFAMPPFALFFTAMWDHLTRLITIPFFVLSIIGFLIIQKDLWFVILLGLYGVLHIFFFRMHILTHDFFLVHMLPFVAVTSCFTIAALQDALKNKPALKAVAAIAFCGVLVHSNIINYQLYDTTKTDKYYLTGKYFEDATPEDETFFYDKITNTILYYSNRSIDMKKYMTFKKMRESETLKKFDSLFF